MDPLLAGFVQYLTKPKAAAPGKVTPRCVRGSQLRSTAPSRRRKAVVTPRPPSSPARPDWPIHFLLVARCYWASDARPEKESVRRVEAPAIFTRLLGQLDQERQQIFNDWRDLCDFIRPRAAGSSWATPNGTALARVARKQIIDSSGSFAAGTLASGMMSGVTSAGRPWFRLTVPDPDLAEYGSVKNWLHDVTVRMQMRYVRSNFYNKLPLVYNDLGVFGTSAVLLEEDDLSGLRYYDLPIGSYYLALDERQKVGVFAREFQMTVRQIVKKFGVIKGTRDIDWSRISTAVKNQWDLGNYDTYLEVGHVIEPNEAYDREKFGSAYLPYSSCYYEKGNQNSDILLEEKGYHEFPVFAPRWEVTGEDAYGTSCPGMVALGDIKALQVMKKRGLQAIEKG
jgi:hypothetical protein